MQVAEPDRRAGQGLGDDGRDDCPRRLPWAERVERPDRHDRHGERTEIRLGHLVGGDLAGGVGRLALQRVRLRDGDRAGRAVDLTRRGVHEPGDADLAACLEDVHRPLNVGTDVAGRRLV